MTDATETEKIGLFTSLKLASPISVSHIVTMHYFKYTKDFHFPGERHDFWELAYVDQGEVGVAAEKQGVMILRQGEVIFHKPDEYHEIWANNCYAHVIILSFVCDSPSMDFFEGKIISCGNHHKDILARIISAGEVYFRGPLDDDVYKKKMDIAPDCPFGSGQVIKNYLELLLILLIQADPDNSRANAASVYVPWQGENDVVRSVIRILTDNIYGSVSMDEILRRISFSKSYLTRLFRNNTGFTIMEYYSNMKIDEAKKLISENSLSLTEIAEKLGYYSIHYFSSQFKKKTRMTPSEYKKTVGVLAIL
ncbi:MAG: AraC family transcriptional regulator [Clostridiales bacterium]|jgi:AraC-like DNA-binding protein|nr:AraC family transcriptional regulator [Clostridiales bacterium]